MMMDKQRLHPIMELLKEAAAGAKHNRLQGELDRWAQAQGFSQGLNGNLPNGGRPDVLRSDNEASYLFIGDAKDSENETPNDFATYVRIAGYMDTFADSIKNGSIKGGRFAIATDDEAMAKRWVTCLNWLAFERDLADTAGIGPAFAVERIDDRTWIVWW
jgi:hypothetical protein